MLVLDHKFKMIISGLHSTLGSYMFITFGLSDAKTQTFHNIHRICWTAAAADKDLAKTSHSSDRGQTQNGEDDGQVPESQWWSGLHDDRVNARATGRPRYIPTGPATQSHVTTTNEYVQEKVGADRVETATVVSASAGNAAFCSVLYCLLLVNVFEWKT